jgi:putative DNA primase/helicase
MMPAVVTATTDPAEWFTNLYTGCDGWLTLFSVDRTTGEQHVDWAPIDQADQLARIAENHSATCCVWFGVATRKQNLGGRRGGGDDCLHIPALWADIDVEGPNHKGAHQLPTTLDAARLIIEEFPLPPSAVIRTGGGLQPWWFLTEPIGVDEARQLLAGWGATWAELGRRHGWHVDNVFDVARVMRLPGTTNHKTVPTPVTGKACWDRRYNPSEFEPHLLDPPPAPEPGRIPYIGPERP